MASNGGEEGSPTDSNAGVDPSERRPDPGDTGFEHSVDSDTNDGVVSSTVEDASKYGLSLTLIGGLLLALGYYGYVAVTGPQALGQAIPGPFYLLAFALLFVLELFRSRKRGAMALVRATALALFYGGLTAFAIEGSVYLWYNPDAALDGFVGITVLAVSLIVAGLAYFLYLAVLESYTSG
ncbi:hypothetical protein [Natrinema gelatinilyticum]|uniref:hypothetical protein n=1 Tax=Natrinema gelatinilyticum TaxID=2961571 RepID=UPI0020C3C438|nr:hypothetical protein [Natrinema gelatinilyticum]